MTPSVFASEDTQLSRETAFLFFGALALMVAVSLGACGCNDNDATLRRVDPGRGVAQEALPPPVLPPSRVAGPKAFGLADLAADVRNDRLPPLMAIEWRPGKSFVTRERGHVHEEILSKGVPTDEPLLEVLSARLTGEGSTEGMVSTAASAFESFRAWLVTRDGGQSGPFRVRAIVAERIEECPSDKSYRARNERFEDVVVHGVIDGSGLHVEQIAYALVRTTPPRQPVLLRPRPAAAAEIDALPLNRERDSIRQAWALEGDQAVVFAVDGLDEKEKRLLERGLDLLPSSKLADRIVSSNGDTFSINAFDVGHVVVHEQCIVILRPLRFIFGEEPEVVEPPYLRCAPTSPWSQKPPQPSEASHPLDRSVEAIMGSHSGWCTYDSTD